MWEFTKESYPVLFFDSTGTINKKVTNQPVPFFYTISFHNKLWKKYVPLFEFVTTDQSQKSVLQYLTSAFFVLSDYVKKLQHTTQFFSRTIFVTDHSDVLINSALSVFNNCTLAQYLQWSYNIILCKKNDDKYFNVMNIIIYICSTHFLNTMRKKAKKITKENDQVNKDFLFSFGLIQNSDSLEEIEKYIKHIYNIFNTKYVYDFVIHSLDYIKNEIINRALHKDENDNDTISKKSNNQDFNNNEYFIKCENLNEVYKSSPFRLYFEKYFNKLRADHINLQLVNKAIIKDNNKIINSFYFPSLIKLIQERMFILPLWTGIMLKIFKAKNKKTFLFPENFFRLTNNPAEGRFNIVKNNIFIKERKKKRRLTLSEVTSKLHTDVKATYRYNFKKSRKD